MKQIGEISLDRMVRAVEKVRQRLERTTAALNAANIDYALVGGNAVAAWVSRIEEAAFRNTRDVDILLRREDLEKAIPAMEAAGFVYGHARGIDMFLDGPDGKARDAVPVVFANEKVRKDYVLPTPDVNESVFSDNKRILLLEALVRMKLTSYRDKDRTHLRDMIELELIDETWPAQFEAPLNTRLQELIDDPDG